MDFRILGPLEVHDGDRPLALGGTKQRALLALLLLHANEVVSSERLIAELWGEARLEDSSKALQVAISRLRRVLQPDLSSGQTGELLVTRRPGYELRIQPAELDLRRFEERLSAGRAALGAGDPAAARAMLDDALAIWRGPALADLAYESFSQGEISRLEELRTSAIEDRIAADLELGRHVDVVAELQELVRRHPLRERLREQLMLALYRAGRQADALEVYQDARRALTGELGIDPSRELRELHQAILQQDPGLDLAPAAEAATETPAGVFVGRAAEVAELAGGLEDAFAGRGRLFLLVGEPGIGKSRLAEELMARARARGARVLVGRCWEAGGAPAYWPWVQSLRAYVRDSDTAALRSQLGTGATDLAQMIPELRHRFPDLGEATSLESEAARFRLFDATAEFLRRAADARPLLLVLDDLHAADAPSLLLLRFLARELGSTRVLLVGAYRDVDPIPRQPLTEALADLAHEPVTRRIALRGLSEREVAEFVELAGSDVASGRLVAGLHGETEGNPLFVGEIMRLVSVEGVGQEATGEPRLTIPQSVRDVIARRLTYLSAECNRVLVLASVLGREFALDALAHLSGVSEDELLETLDEAMLARVVSEVPAVPGHLRFAHVLIRDTLYDGLTAARRVRLHRLAVEALEALYGEEPGPHLAELAHHSVAGSDFDRALRYARRAGDRGLALLAYEEAARLYTTALEALDFAGASDEETRCELLLLLGDAEAQAGNSPAARRAFLDAAGIARRLGLARELAGAAAGYGGRIVWGRAGDDDRLVPLLEEGLAALADGDLELRATLLARLAGALRDEHKRDRRDALSREAVELARRTGSQAALAYALDGRAHAIVAPDTVAECLALGSELREVAEASGDMERVVAGYVLRVVAQLQAGDLRGAEADVAAARAIAEELRQPAQLWLVGGEQAMLALAEGRLSEAEELIDDTFALGERAEPDAAIPVYKLQRYTLCDFRGSLEELEPAICDLVTEYPARPLFRCVLAHLHARLGRTGEARRALDDLARGDFSALPFDQEWLYGMSLLAETSALLSDTDSAPVLYRLLIPWAALNVVDQAEGIRGSLARYLGILATTTKRWEDAEPRFEAALTMNSRMGARPWLAHTQDDYARMLLARDDAGDRERALELIGDALATYRELGMESWALRAEELERALSAAGDPG